MIIYVYSTQIEIGQIICDHLTSLGNLCFQFPTTGDLAHGLSQLNNYPELLILDYTIYNHNLFNLRNYFSDIKINIPLVFYNDPCLTKSSRPKHWLSQIKLLQKDVQIEDFYIYEKLFMELANLIEDKELSPFIKLMEPPLPIPDYLKRKTLTLTTIKNNKNDNIETFRENVKLPKNLYYLLEIFQKHKSIPLDSQSIIEIYNKDNKKITENSLKVLISKLKGEIKKDPNCNFKIDNCKGLYLFLKKSDI